MLWPGGNSDNAYGESGSSTGAGSKAARNKRNQWQLAYHGAA